MQGKRSISRVRQRVPIVTGALVLGAMLALVASPAHAATPSLIRPDAGTTYRVNSTADSVDADAGTPVCADANGKCTLRAAVMQANFHVRRGHDRAAGRHLQAHARRRR